MKFWFAFTLGAVAGGAYVSTLDQQQQQALRARVRQLTTRGRTGAIASSVSNGVGDVADKVTERVTDAVDAATSTVADKIDTDGRTEPSVA